ncbi:uncharacterized protein LOC129723552 isoform X2 [Wyeomyia smithii]|nr:uncharacterized protein LOC129723552 isoform X2 [Wyeomyia smithii]
MWCVSETDCGVVNILCFIEPSKHGQNTAKDILQILRKRVNAVKKYPSNKFSKAFWKRNHAFGYAFWSNDLNLDIVDMIRTIDTEMNIDEARLREIVSDLSTAKLPANHSAACEILIGNQAVKDKPRGSARYFILFRFHHSLGDGYSVLHFILTEIADLGNYSECMPSLNNFKKRSIRESIALVISSVYNIPAYLFRVMSHEQHANDWQIDALGSSKITCWQNESSVLESNRWHQLLENIHIKLSRVQYSSVLLTALSGTLYNYFKAKGQYPKFLTVASPIRIRHQDPTDMQFENAFVTPMKKLKLSPGVELSDPNRAVKLKYRLAQLKQSTVELRSSSDMLITRWMMSFLPGIFPGPLLTFLAKQFRIIASISVMPPLAKRIHIGMYELHDMFYWPPAFGTVGFNFAVLSYAGELQLALLADRQMLRSHNEGQQLLRELFLEIERMNIVLRECAL